MPDKNAYVFACVYVRKYVPLPKFRSWGGGGSSRDKTHLNSKAFLRRQRRKAINRLAINPFGQLFVSRLLPVSSPPTRASPLGCKFDRAIDSIVEIG